MIRAPVAHMTYWCRNSILNWILIRVPEPAHLFLLCFAEYQSVMLASALSMLWWAEAGWSSQCESNFKFTFYILSAKERSEFVLPRMPPAVSTSTHKAAAARRAQLGIARLHPIPDPSQKILLSHCPPSLRTSSHHHCLQVRVAWGCGGQMSLMTRIFPCKECADHFKEVMK